MKNLKGALPPEDSDISNNTYFYNLGIVLMILGLIIAVAAIVIFVAGLGSSDYSYVEGVAAMNPQLFVFALFMSVVLIVTGIVLILISKKVSSAAIEEKSKD